MSEGSGPHRSRSRSPRESPKAERLGDTELRIRGLTRNVTAEHVKEIMGTFGPLERVEFAVDDKVHLPRGFADISYKSEEHGRLAKEYMHEGQIDGAQVSVIYRRNAGRANTKKKLRSRSPMTRRRKSPSPVGDGEVTVHPQLAGGGKVTVHPYTAAIGDVKRGIRRDHQFLEDGAGVPGDHGHILALHIAAGAEAQGDQGRILALHTVAEVIVATVVEVTAAGVRVGGEVRQGGDD
ncbi:LOW QUALITY PROTEIN: Transformer-2 sex-determining protein [Picochlorum sp. SENEW3]|nr:LOW QUALITY PROTEIN: Transformer-2 sex-determining protein [Picochlorum sp. SENEW3]